MTHPLDMPTFAALTTRHMSHAQVAGGAMRYDPGIVPFAVTDPGDNGAMARLVQPGESVVFLQAERVETPLGFVEELRAPVVQLVAQHLPRGLGDARIVSLDHADAEAMLALATATRPGPFTLRALELGPFWGIHENRKLVAMAGIRMSLPGWTEVSGVCSAPEARGKGYARLLSLRAMSEIADRGDSAFLHAWSTNAAAIALYKSIGFSVRAELQVLMARRLPDQAG